MRNLRSFALIELLIVVTILALRIWPANSEEPIQRTPAIHAWLGRQHNVNGEWCCNMADGHILNTEEWRMHGSTYQVDIEGRWLDVPPSKLVALKENDPPPGGFAIVWYLHTYSEGPDITIYCFLPGVML